jgi:hypothetical protein
VVRVWLFSNTSLAKTPGGATNYEVNARKGHTMASSRENVTTAPVSIGPTNPSLSPARPAGTLLQSVGGWSGIIGGLLVCAANGLHPHPNDFHLEALLTDIAHSNTWPLIHLTLVIALFLVLTALVAIAFTVEEEPGATIARFACVASLLGGALIFVSTAIDGFAMNQLARSWFDASSAEKAAALRIADAFEVAQYAIYSLSVVLFLGIGILLYGFATLRTSTYPRPLGWLAIVAGAGALVVGIAQVMRGPEFRATEIFFVLFSMLSTLWILLMGLLLLRKSRDVGVGATAR